MRNPVPTYENADECLFVERSAPGPGIGNSTRPRWRNQSFRSALLGLCAIDRQPLVRWFVMPVLGIPAVYGGYTTMLNFWLAFGMSPSLGLHVFAVFAGVTSGLAAVARFRG